MLQGRGHLCAISSDIFSFLHFMFFPNLRITSGIGWARLLMNWLFTHWRGCHFRLCSTTVHGNSNLHIHIARHAPRRGRFPSSFGTLVGVWSLRRGGTQGTDRDVELGDFGRSMIGINNGITCKISEHVILLIRFSLSLLLLLC